MNLEIANEIVSTVKEVITVFLHFFAINEIGLEINRFV